MSYKMQEDVPNYSNFAFVTDTVTEDSSQITKPAEPENKISKDLTLSDKERSIEIRSILKNVVLTAISGALVTSPQSGLTSSTTSLLDNDRLGITSLATSSVFQFLGSTFLLSYVNQIWGIRKMVSVTLILPIPFILSYLYPSWGTTLPAGILLGLGQASITSTFMYGNALGYYYSRLSNGNINTILVAVSGLLTSFISGGLFYGNIILYAVLNTGSQANLSASGMNVSYEVCGAQYCNQELTNLPTMKKPEPEKYYTLVGIFASMAILGGVLSLFIRDFSVELGSVVRKKSDYFAIMKETLGLLRQPRGYLLVAWTVFTGMEQVFVMAEYTKAYISCTMGIPKVGLMMLTYGGVQVVVCMSQGLLVKLFGRIALVTVGHLMVVACLLAALLWHPNAQEVGIFFVIAVFWAAGDAFLVPTNFAMYAIMFEDNIEGSFALATFWWALGFMIALVWSQFLCISVKLYITIAVGCVSLICYIMLEVGLRKKAEQKPATH